MSMVIIQGLKSSLLIMQGYSVWSPTIIEFHGEFLSRLRNPLLCSQIQNPLIVSRPRNPGMTSKLQG